VRDEFEPDEPLTELWGTLSGWRAASTRVLNILGEHGIGRICDLTAMTEDDLRELPGFGKGSIAEVRRVLTAHRMTLKGDQQRA
jgi:DNA-directed RNA polymerase alpha subunit